MIRNSILIVLLFCVITVRLNLAEVVVEECGSSEQRSESKFKRWNPYMHRCENITCNFTKQCESYQYSNCDSIHYSNYYCLCNDFGPKSNSSPHICVSNPTTAYGMSCYESYSYCSYNNSEFNQICVNGECKCAPKFNGSDRLHVCFKSKCDYSYSDCQRDDRNRICDYNSDQCVCGPNFYEYSTTRKCIEKTLCESTAYCDSNEFCISHRCECLPNYRRNSTTGLCDFQYCTHDSNCSLHDRNQICYSISKNGYCNCRSGYEIDVSSKLCVQLPTTTIMTTTNKIPYSNCYTASNCDMNQICIKSKCECLPGNVYSKKWGFCEHNRCTYDYECQKYDSNRECDYGFCICKSGYTENTATKFCNLTLDLHLSYGSDSLWWIAIPIVLIPALIIIAFFVRRKSVAAQRLRQVNGVQNDAVLSEPVASVSTATDAPDNTVIDEKFTFYDPPPPYSKNYI